MEIRALTQLLVRREMMANDCALKNSNTHGFQKKLLWKAEKYSQLR